MSLFRESLAAHQAEQNIARDDRMPDRPGVNCDRTRGFLPQVHAYSPQLLHFAGSGPHRFGRRNGWRLTPILSLAHVGLTEV